MMCFLFDFVLVSVSILKYIRGQVCCPFKSFTVFYVHEHIIFVSKVPAVKLCPEAEALIEGRMLRILGKYSMIILLYGLSIVQPVGQIGLPAKLHIRLLDIGCQVIVSYQSAYDSLQIGIEIPVLPIGPLL